MAQKVTLKKDKETTNKVRFTQQEGPVVGTLYLSKEAAGEKAEITIIVED